MTITPVVPRHLDQYIDTDQGIIVDSTHSFIEAYTQINAGAETLVWDSTSGFQAGWSGRYVNEPSNSIYRLVLDPPSSYTVYDVVRVRIINSNSETISYKFRVGLEKLTTETDLLNPRIIEAGSYVWTARVHNNESSWPINFDGPNNVYLQVVNPRSSEVIVVPGEDVGLIYDPNLNKVIIYFNHHGTIWYMLADPSDIPDTKNQVRSIRETVNLGTFGPGRELTNNANDGGFSTETFPPVKQAVLESASIAVFGAGEGQSNSYQEASFPPVKQAVLENISIAVFGTGLNFTSIQSPYNNARTPNLASGMLTDSVVKIRVGKPTVEPEATLFKGYYLIRFDTNLSTPSIIDYQDFGTSDYIEFIDYNPVAKVRYAVMPVFYKHSNTTETIISIYGSTVTVEPNTIAQLLSVSVFGSGARLSWTDSSFPPIGP